MINALVRIGATLAMLVLGAHFLRAGHKLLIAACLVVVVLAWVPRVWARRVVQGVLFIAAAEWLRTAAMLTDQRVAAGEPWTRMVVILGSVMAFNLLIAVLLATPFCREYEKPALAAAPPDAGAG